MLLLAGKGNGTSGGNRAGCVLPVTLQGHVHLARPEARCARKMRVGRVGATWPAPIVRSPRLEVHQDPSSGPGSRYLWLLPWLCLLQMPASIGSWEPLPKHWSPMKAALGSHSGDGCLVLWDRSWLQGAQGQLCHSLLGRGPATFWLFLFLLLKDPDNRGLNLEVRSQDFGP